MASGHGTQPPGRTAVAQVGTAGTYAFRLRLVASADADRLESWTGRPVQVRNGRGLLMVGVFFGLDYAEHRDDKARWDVALTVTRVTADTTAPVPS
ncbi:hypothetical protein [Micromonospora palomenae]|uniref:hypothetical protein n=1 Tax=Micromonospora palomenae TaxID=1461247 RepID=UPI003F8AEB08